MSFFGFNTSLPRDRGHPTSGPGFSQPVDPFASLSRKDQPLDEEDAIDFEDTYDGLGDQLQEAGDEANDDTFGGGAVPIKGDYRYFDETAKAADVIEVENPQASYQNQSYSGYAAPQITLQKSMKTGYERYEDAGYIPALTVDSDIWGMPSTSAPSNAQAEGSGSAVPARQYMSLDEVEAMMLIQEAQGGSKQSSDDVGMSLLASLQGGGLSQSMDPYAHLQYPMHGAYPPHMVPGVPPQQMQAQQSQLNQGPPMQILQNPNRQVKPELASSKQQHRAQGGSTGRSQGFAPSAILPPLGGPSLLLNQQDEAKRSKRNQKIFAMSKNNGFMTPQDKSFIARVQLQQLITATGNPSEQSADSAVSEDFYYQVYRQIRNARPSSRQSSGGLAQTYLYQQNGRQHGRRHPRQTENHVTRMEQQIQRAVEAAKVRPKQNQLVIEGSLGKISFSNAKTPKPLLNIKRTDKALKRSSIGFGLAEAQSQQSGTYKNDRKTILSALEDVFDTLLLLEMHDRAQNFQSFDAADIMKTNDDMKSSNEKLWKDLRIMEPIIPNATTPHPFIALLSHAKGKRAIPRIFRYLDSQQKLTILTMLVVHLDTLDVVRLAQPTANDTPFPATVREEIDLFLSSVIPTLFKYINEVPMNMILGLLDLVLNRIDLHQVAHTKIGLVFLTTFVSRAEMIKQAGTASEQDLQHWTDLYNRLFDSLEPVFGDIFPPSVSSVDDVYVWQFLAAIGAEATPDQQIRLVSAVTVRVMDTVKQGRTLPPDLGAQKLAHVNLFLNAMGIDAQQLM